MWFKERKTAYKINRPINGKEKSFAQYCEKLIEYTLYIINSLYYGNQEEKCNNPTPSGYPKALGVLLTTFRSSEVPHCVMVGQ